MGGPPSGGRGAAVAVLSAAHAAVCAAILGTTATQLLYRGASPPHRRCRLGADVTTTAPCDYALALSAVALLGAAALLVAAVATLLADAAVSVAEGVAARVAGRVAAERASLAWKMVECFRWVFGGWLMQAATAVLVVLGAVWWAVGTAVLASRAAAADARGLAGGAARHAVVALSGVALATQLALMALVSCAPCCACCCRGRRRGRGQGRAAFGGADGGAAAAAAIAATAAAARAGAGGGGSGSSSAAGRTQPLLPPDSVRMPAYPLAGAV
ncbi:hypothetical protein Rsub_06622 [Raphidocelis subcapitata]|uniref:Uncharacterized protein n=1 Tax=Raphidocelis subcapitata TaxID=307507 RepID=A0A2V0P1P7_9CHLO|nr:hypothetical protein Rsub_06622 [Raphidocelis subcapitata]|eukprot:GBF93489.1 hypothetical protein Rsub_06622 [Raphidocelis subcapitata]